MKGGGLRPDLFADVFGVDDGSLLSWESKETPPNANNPKKFKAPKKGLIKGNQWWFFHKSPLIRRPFFSGGFHGIGGKLR